MLRERAGKGWGEGGTNKRSEDDVGENENRWDENKLV